MRGATHRASALIRIRRFQSTHPLRGATLPDGLVFYLPNTFQSTHPLRGATSRRVQLKIVGKISIHAPLAGCDLHNRAPPALKIQFQSTHPLRGATFCHYRADCSFNISIHAPLAGCDNQRISQKSQKSHFNPRTPCGVRPTQRNKPASVTVFQSTHPLRGATAIFLDEAGILFISIHAPLAGCDPHGARLLLQPQGHFNPRTPCGVRRATATVTPAAVEFQSTHPLRGATEIVPGDLAVGDISIHAPLAGCDPDMSEKASQEINFNPRTPCGVRQKFCIIIILVNIFQSTHPLRGATGVTLGLSSS